MLVSLGKGRDEEDTSSGMRIIFEVGQMLTQGKEKPFSRGYGTRERWKLKKINSFARRAERHGEL